MATSGSYDFSVNRNELIELAHQHIGAIGEGESCTTAQITEASKLLNMLVKLRAADGMPLWSLKRGTILPFTGESSIATNSHVVSSYVSTTLSAAEAALQTVLSVTSSTGMTAGDQVGIELDSGDVQWTTIVTVDSSIQITITTALTGAASSGSRVYTYTASTGRIARPLRILEANTLDVANNTSSEMEIEVRSDYFARSNRTSEGTPQFVYYDPALDNGNIYLWPRFEDGDTVVEFTYHRPFQDFDNSTDTPDFPDAFFLPLMLELAALLGPKFNVSIEERARLFNEAKTYRDEALTTTYPEGSLLVLPDMEE